MYKVKNVFRDKYTNELYKVGDTFESEDPERIKDLIDRKLIEGANNAPSVSEDKAVIKGARRSKNSTKGKRD